ncbi:hypothetical protein AB1Y20_021476 [Prymnesium parvum]|uniref:Cilia- and flagella-associated protein 157 n=1 Tax=Prymnesium parvum TaxID=97485 RepID=A0AB34JJR0_PRYPA|mmetsp:Transcript_11276/g.27896  ORF Transcript_11276/g.27896 Transcript_11276/m.27896 type:complete len:249 (-) Transcript_11276:109-855(-)|eukprot:CAMPEP_0195602556 /NCGR_PEP_ID=MMETSP0815-20121206/5665_1 /TAXON_ID=97485 /ORGANISM="Prymnesium parvum, Strain Texoma1" /LENGTH=248 /DNA_ID=CAMNT_0040742139 /DNA_START=1 /DNA_END=747 /DNA_ORIENTATION=-
MSCTSSAKVASPRCQSTGRRPSWSPPRSGLEKDQLIEKLVYDNDVLMQEVAHLDEQLRQSHMDNETLERSTEQLRLDQRASEQASSIAERLVASMEQELKLIRSEREETARQHASDKEFLTGIFRELEAQLSLTRSEREELNTRVERERRAAQKRIRELEELSHAERVSKEQMRLQCDAEKQALHKQFEQRIAGLRLEKEQAKLDKATLKRLEKELGELKALSTSVLGPLARWQQQPGGEGAYERRSM